jgi:hypothetical protein
MQYHRVSEIRAQKRFEFRLGQLQQMMFVKVLASCRINSAIRGAHNEHPPGPQHAPNLRDEPCVFPYMLQSLERDDRVD